MVFYSCPPGHSLNLIACSWIPLGTEAAASTIIAVHTMFWFDANTIITPRYTAPVLRLTSAGRSRAPCVVTVTVAKWLITFGTLANTAPVF